MKTTKTLLLAAILILSLVLAGCASPAAAPETTEAPAPEATEAVAPEATEEAASPAGEAALKVTGLVDNEMAWTEDEVKAMETISVESTNKNGETSTYTGVSINSLLEMAGIQAGATTLVFVADDGYTAEAALAEVQSCTDCIVSFRNQGGFSTVLPGFAGSLQVKGVIEIQVK